MYLFLYFGLGCKWRLKCKMKLIEVILDSFDIVSEYGYNALIQALIEIIQDTMESQEKALQFSCFEFWVIPSASRSKIGLEFAAPALLTFWKAP